MVGSRLAAVIGALGCSAAAVAQAAPGAPGAIEGMVFDSIRAAPLAGALVVAEGTSRAVRTDAHGRFTLDSLAAGRYVIAVESEALDSLGVAAPPREVVVGAGATRGVLLAVPSAATLIALACAPAARGEGAGLLLGTVRDAATGAPVAGGAVEVSWSVWSFSGTRMTRSRAAITAPSGDDGIYRACGVPTAARVAVRARAGARASGSIEVRVGESGLARRDLLVGGPGDAEVQGTITAADGTPLAGARVAIVGDSLYAVSDTGGAFRLGAQPSGTRLLEVRRVGFAVQQLEMELRPGTPASVAVTLVPNAPVLDTVRVTARAGGASEAAGFEERRRVGIGYFLGRDAIEQRGFVGTAELLRGAPGMTVRIAATSQSVRWTRAGLSCSPILYLDGSRSDLAAAPHSPDVEGIEVYSRGEAPSRYGGATATCAVVLIWTRRAPSATAAPASSTARPPDSAAAPP
jgi:hypothetical protein